MKQYLKMADLFPVEIRTDDESGSLICDEDGVILESFSGEKVADYALHAINSHDELVQINQELMDALVALDDCYSDTSRDYLTRAELLHHKAVRADVAVVIDKAEGGAA